MSRTREVIVELLGLTKEQIENVVAGNHQAVQTAIPRHEALLQELDAALTEVEPDDETIELVGQLQRQRTKLQSLLRSELTRIDVQMRLLAGVHSTAGYPEHRAELSNRLFNRKV